MCQTQCKVDTEEMGACAQKKNVHEKGTIMLIASIYNCLEKSLLISVFSQHKLL